MLNSQFFRQSQGLKWVSFISFLIFLIYRFMNIYGHDKSLDYFNISTFIHFQSFYFGLEETMFDVYILLILFQTKKIKK